MSQSAAPDNALAGAVVGPESYGKALGAIACCQQIVGSLAGPAFFLLQGRTSEGCVGAGCFFTELRGISFMFAAGAPVPPHIQH